MDGCLTWVRPLGAIPSALARIAVEFLVQVFAADQFAAVAVAVAVVAVSSFLHDDQSFLIWPHGPVPFVLGE